MGKRFKMPGLGIGIAQHGFEMVSALIKGTAEHQLLIQQSLAGLKAPAFTAAGIKSVGPKGQQMQVPREQV
jgi:hypothetical protein